MTRLTQSLRSALWPLSPRTVWLWYLLALHPHVRARVRAEVADEIGDRVPSAADLDRLVWTRAAFQEAMRTLPP